MATVDITIQTAVNINTAAASPAATPAVNAQDGVITTTAWELKADSIAHSFRNLGIPLPLPAPGTSSDQLRNLIIDLGMRTEQIKLTGVLVDRGTPSASNPRKQTLMDVARTQFDVTINPGTARDANAVTSNPNAYLLLTLGTGTEPSDDASGFTAPTQLILQDDNSSGSDSTLKGYRGMITELSFTQKGGRPDIWVWNMTFYVIMNEHDF